jgi:hypothetical protein
MTDPDVQRELEANKQRARRINEQAKEQNRSPDDPTSLIDDAYQAFVEPPLLNVDLDPQEAERRAIQNDEAARET